MVKRSRTGNSISFEIKIWYDKKTGEIRMTAPDYPHLSFHTTIKRDPESRRGHPNLYGKLEDCLREEGAPAPLPER